MISSWFIDIVFPLQYLLYRKQEEYPCYVFDLINSATQKVSFKISRWVFMY